MVLPGCGSGGGLNRSEVLRIIKIIHCERALECSNLKWISCVLVAIFLSVVSGFLDKLNCYKLSKFFFLFGV